MPQFESLESRTLHSVAALLVNHAPTLKTITAFGTAIDTVPFAITSDQLLAASNATDVDGDAISFQITAVGAAGTLTRNGAPVAAFPTTVSSGDTLVWTGNATANGSVSAFSVQAFDGALASAKPVAVKIKTVKFPSVAITATKPKASEATDGTSTGLGQFTITRTNGDKTQPLTVHYTIGGTAENGDNYNAATPLSGTAIIAAGKPSVAVPIVPVDDGLATGDLTVILTLAADSSYTPSSHAAAMVTIKDIAPVVSMTANRKSASESNTSTTGQFTVTRTGDLTVPLTVSIELAGTATFGSDYYSPGHGSLPHSLTIPTGAKSVTLTIVAIARHTPGLNVTLTVEDDSLYLVNSSKSIATVNLTV
jgi:hypothetical protein